ncbi:tripartite tricarboxylate transporter substrate binding protein BugE [soil metagenome]
MSTTRRSFVAAGLGLLAVTPAFGAGDYPVKPVHFIVPFPPGGGTDAFARILGVALSKRWGQQVVIDNRAGAQGNIGTLQGVRSAPDGYTLILAHQGVMTVNPSIYYSICFDPLRDLVAVSRGTEQPFVLVANPNVPIQSLKDLTDLARREPGKLTFASSASGPQMAGEMYKMASGTDLLHIKYKGAGPAVVDLLAGQVDLMVANPVSVAPYVKSGKLRGIVVFSEKRIEQLPDVPTAVEAGYPQLGKNPEWYGVTVPAGTPAAIVTRLNADITSALATDEVRSAVLGLGLTPSPSTPEEFARQIKADYEVWSKIAKASGVKGEQ